ncbi:TetR/AcrR family transcriptional regulator [candidate division KSB1 bacterium]|nr:TetR/AcrR family transcriptional regulator [candidate division KSB1 bacterium]
MTEHQSRDVRKEQILNAAFQLFASKGFENSSVDDIASSAGLSKGAIYWHFPSKLEILFELTDRFVHGSQAEIVHMADPDQMGVEALYKSHRAFLERMQTNPAHDLLFNQLVSLSNRYPEIRDRLNQYHREWDDTVSALFDRAVENGHFRAFRTREVAQAINALYDGIMIRAQMDPSINPIEVIETTTKLIYDALVTAAAPRSPEARA